MVAPTYHKLKSKENAVVSSANLSQQRTKCDFATPMLWDENYKCQEEKDAKGLFVRIVVLSVILNLVLAMLSLCLLQTIFQTANSRDNANGTSQQWKEDLICIRCTKDEYRDVQNFCCSDIPRAVIILMKLVRQKVNFVSIRLMNRDFINRDYFYNTRLIF